MRILPNNEREWIALLLFPFKVYLVTAVVSWIIWRIVNDDYIRGALAEATWRIALGYFICVCIFIIAAFIQFFIGLRNDALKSALFGIAAFIILILLLPASATA
jgi:hypothetical protein